MFIVGEQYAFHMLEASAEHGWAAEFVATVMAVDGPRLRIDCGCREITITLSHATYEG